MWHCGLHAEGDPVEADLAESCKPAESMDSGLDSVVTSASAASPKWSRTAVISRPRSSGGNTVGVPPPTKIVETAGASGASTRAANSSSVIAAST